MGIFDKLFKKNQVSVNYHFSFSVLKRLFFNEKFNIDEYFGDENEVRSLINKVLLVVKEVKKVNIPHDFFTMPFYFIDKVSCKGILFEVPGVKEECDCNFILIKQDKEGKKEYYTNEYFKEDRKFVLYLNQPDLRMSLTSKLKTKEDFFELV